MQVERRKKQARGSRPHNTINRLTIRMNSSGVAPLTPRQPNVVEQREHLPVEK